MVQEDSCRLDGSCVFCAPLERHIGRHISRVLTNMSVDISVEGQSICQSRCVARFIGRHIDRASVDMSTDTRPRVVVRLLADMSIDRLPTFRRYFTATFVLVTVDII